MGAAPDARTLAPDDGAFNAGRGLHAEVGYGLSLFGSGFTATPNAGFRLADGGARDWRLTSVAGGDRGFEIKINLGAMQREPADGNRAEHGVTVRSLIRWQR